MPPDDDRFLPSRHQPRDPGNDDRFAEYGAAEDVADRAIGAQPHFLEPKLGHARFVRGDGGAFDADAMFLDGFGGVDGDLVVGGIAGGEAQVVVFEVDGEVRVDEFLLDVLPDDACHFVAVKFDNGVSDLDFAMVAGGGGGGGGHCSAEVMGCEDGVPGFEGLCWKWDRGSSDASTYWLG